jgi:hypothetical protein
MILISAKLEEMEQVINTHNTNVMALILLQKQRIDTLEAECDRLCAMVASMHLDSLSLASNNLGSGLHGLREEKIVSQNRDPIDIEEPNPPHLDGGEEEQGSVQT